MSMYKEWYDSPFKEIIVTYKGDVLIGEFSEKPLSPNEARFVATILNMAAAQADLVRNRDA